MTTQAMESGVSMRMGDSIDLAKTVPALKAITVGIGREHAIGQRRTGLLAFAFFLTHGQLVKYGILNADNRAISGADFQGESERESGEPIEERMSFDFQKIDPNVDTIVIGAIASGKGGDLPSPYLRLYDRKNNNEIARFDTNKGDNADAGGLIFGRLYRHGMTWNFEATDEAPSGNMEEIASHYQ